MKQKKTAIATTLGLVLAVGVAGVLYVQTRPESAERHADIVDRFGSLTAWDARIAEETLAVRHGLSAHYDRLTESAKNFAAEARQLEHDLAPLASAHPELAQGLGDMLEQMERRSDAVERFKRKNSVLKNSLYYLPLAGQQVLDALVASPPTEPGRAAELSSAVSSLVQAVLTQNLLGGRAQADEVARQLDRVRTLEPDAPPAAGKRLRLLLAHAKTASGAQQDVDPIVRREVLDAAVSGKLSALEQTYGEVFDASLKHSARYRALLYAWSMALLLAVAVVGYKLRSLYARLEERVADRTRELNEALEELWGEMALAKKIQTALVPRELSLRDCEVAAVMRPTDQVGGDYYDVFEVEGTEWVLIGDVSGHGVPAGLVMMMCQTAVHSVLAAHPEIAPDELLATVNRTLTRNIELLGEDKYMTISALRRDADGTFTVAGMHQDLLVYRSQTKSVEHLPTQGTWLGLTSDIRALLPTRTLKLHPGDALVLYTDGITEARRGDQMLEVEGLRDTVSESGAESAREILDSILRALSDYDVHDDVAAVVIKQGQPARERGDRGRAAPDAAA